MADGQDTLPTSVRSALLTAKRQARSLDNIRAVDFGFAYEAGSRTQETSIRFHMNRKASLTELPPDQRLPTSIDGVRIDVLAVGYKPHQGNARAPHDTLQPGLSIGSLKLGTTGTLGMLVHDLVTGYPCILSNWHVLCGGPEAAADDEIGQPGPMDMSSPRAVARLERWLRLSEQYDAAVARLGAEVQTSGKLFGTEFQPTATAVPQLGMQLMKSGAVSGVTSGIVDGVGGSYRLDYTSYGDTLEWMEGFRIVQDPSAPTPALSLSGDSGALWMDGASGSAVGLHFAGEDDESPLNDYALAHSVEEVFSRLNISLAA